MPNSNFANKTPNVPYIKSNHTFVVVYAVGAYPNPTSSNLNSSAVKDKALYAFMEHYFPELYPFDSTNSTVDQSLITSLKDQVRSSILSTPTDASPPRFQNLPVPPFKTKILVRSNLNLQVLRHQLVCDGSLNSASFSSALGAFNSDEGIGSPVATTEIPMESLQASRQRLADTLSLFDRQTASSPNLFASPVNFNFLQSTVQKILDIVLTLVGKNIKAANPALGTDDAQAIRISFDESFATNVTGIEYKLKPQGQTDEPTWKPLKIGYFTNIKYKNIFNDPLTMRMLRHYDSILEQSATTTGFGQQNSLLDTFREAFSDLPGAPPVDSSTPLPGGLTPGVSNASQGAMAAAREGLTFKCVPRRADVNDITELRGTLASIMTSEELRQVEAKAQSDPEVLRKVYVQEKKKRLKAGVQTLEVIDNILNGDASMGNSYVAKILGQFGVQALAKEAMICATFGLNVELSRLTRAVQDILKDEYNSTPDEPKKVEWPQQGPPWYSFLDGEDGKPFGDRVLDVVLSAAAAASFAILSGLAQTLKNACEALRNPDHLIGEIDIVDYIDASSTTNSLGLPTGDFQHLAAQFGPQSGMVPADLSEYLSNLSSILTPLDMCRLMTTPAQVETSLLDRILDFNSVYPATYGPSSVATVVSTQLTSYNALITFFANLSVVTNVDQLCEDYFNANVIPVLDDICLTEGDIVDDGVVDNLLDLLQNPPIVMVPSPDFLCPDSAEFINNPFFTQTLPRLFNTMVGQIETQFAYSLEGAQAAMLEPVLQADSAGLAYLRDKGALDQMDPPPPNPDSSVMTEMADALAEILAGGPGIFANCNIDLAGLGGGDMAAGIEAASIAGDVLQDENVRGALTGLMNNITSLATLQADAAGGDGFIHTTYKFPQSYYNFINNAIPDTPSYVKFRPPQSFKCKVGGGKVHSEMKITTTEYKSGYLRLKSPIDNSSVLKLTYPKNSVGGNIYLSAPRFHPDSPALTVDMGLLDLSGPVNYSWGTPDQPHSTWEAHPASCNSRISTFVQNVSINFINSPGTKPGEPYQSLYVPPADERKLQEDLAGNLFSNVTMGMMEEAFDYVLSNGIYDAGAVNNLNFFKENDLCNPEHAGDLLDADGILEQMKLEFLAAACHDDGPVNDKVRNTVKYGVFNLLIQVTLVELLIKNIFTFAAFKFTDLISMPLMMTTFGEYVKVSIVQLLSRPDAGDFASEITAHFNRRIQRAPVVAAGGLFWPNNTTTLAFPAGTTFSTANLGDQLFYLIQERINFTWVPQNAPAGVVRSTAQTLENVLNEQTNPDSADKIFYEKIIGFHDAYLGSLTSRGPYIPNDSNWVHFLEQIEPKYRNLEKAKSLNYGKFAIEKHISWENVGVWNNDVTTPLNVAFTMRTATTYFGSGTKMGWTAGSQDGSAPNYGSVTIDFAALKSLPVDVFMAACKEWHHVNGLGGGGPKLGFTGCNAVYKLIYYYPPDMLSNWGGSDNKFTGRTEIRDGYMAEAFENPIASQQNFQAAASRGFTSTPLLAYGIDPENPLRRVPLLPVEVASVSANYPGITDVTIRSKHARKGSVDSGYDGELRWFSDRVLPSEITRINNSGIGDFFNFAFNRDVYILAPIFYSMHCSEHVFTDLASCFLPTKQAIMNTFKAANGSDRTAPVPLRRQNAVQSGGPSAPPPPNSLAADFILKAMLQTPIDILKGLAEMIDPHWATSKMIRDITGMGFRAAGAAMDAGMPPGSPITSAHIFEFIFCYINTALNAASAGLGADVSEAPGLFPRFKLEGVDFSSSVLGILMQPPTPIGIILIILEILKNLPTPPDNTTPANRTSEITHMGDPPTLPACDDGPQTQGTFWPADLIPPNPEECND